MCGERMIRVKSRVTIRRPPGPVSEFLVDATNDAKWQKGIVHLQLVSGTPHAVGATYERVQQAMGRNIKTAMRLEEYVPGVRVRFKNSGKIILIEGTYAFTPSPEGTGLEMSLEGEMVGFASMFESVVSEQLEKDLPENLARLKSLLESA